MKWILGANFVVYMGLADWCVVRHQAKDVGHIRPIYFFSVLANILLF